MQSNIVLSNVEYKVVGKRPIRHDGVDKVTGKARYAADVQLPGALHGKVLRSPHAHAIIKSIDTSKAEALPGVMAVVTSKDLAVVPDRLAQVGEDAFLSLRYLSNNVLAGDKVLYKGHAVAAVAAENPHDAEEALKLIQVDYEVLPAVTNVEDAMKPDAPILHEHMTTASFDDRYPQKTNIAGYQQFKQGDVEKGFEEADVVVEREFRTKTVHQGYIEPQSATASWSHDGRITIWNSSQNPFGIRDNTARILGIRSSKIKLIPMEIGGGFGGKLGTYLEPVAAVLSKKSGRSVTLTMSRVDVMEATGPAPGSYMKAKIGVTKDGRITAVEAYLAFEAGAYPGSPIGGATACMLTPYDIPNLVLDAYDVVDNKPKTAAYRAPGAPLGAFAIEILLDELSEKLGMDPIEFRLLNAAKEGTRRADGTLNPPIGVVEVMEAVKSHPHYSAPLEGPNRGRGVAVGFWRNNTGPSCAVANVNGDGTVMLVEGSVDIGGSRVAVAQQLAEVLGIPVEDVFPEVADTDSIGFTSLTAGSGVAFKTGWAAITAARDIKDQLICRAALLWETEPENVEYVDGVLQHKADPELRMSFKEIAPKLNDTGGPVVGRGNVNPGGAGGSAAATLVDLEIDPETGKTQVLRCTVFQDAGKAIHPSYVEGQMQGGTAQGLGWAINEEYVMSDQGQLLNSSLLDYRMMTSLDVPMIDTVIVEVANPGHPFGVRGVGEGSIVPPMAAVANAVYRATGIRMTELPMSPGVLLEAAENKSKG
ncbi:MAG: xanthine dehydrogenase family protein molybdopterin-binding subunit [Chloroflexi bacterium]|nr:xanthine dehydrogenase family protein molybdopterin-binding subunit [Chloroflexota bacterium]MCI0787490.1 xanthine dehydrogenase family protein molybdopterin-binding subunit [Chloroflexota bacterium]MCI0792373.1 xanthine dehydrogenase family protein molybdopterin-binding subunit [Chloroflexota bacterium]MCI0799310.1 xanthine dehydrogenase family protein molybdopterin-binding subunit [Chloroflexota bacterium]MCI0859076.1 xanthine dehydrogenase family protein molybdopterin-binding subunit [Chl